MHRGEIFLVKLGQTQGSEICKTRPCIVLTPNEVVDIYPVCQVVPLTTTEKRNYPMRVKVEKDEVNNLIKDSYAAIDQLVTISKKRIAGHAIGKLNVDKEKEILETIQSYFAY